MNKKIQIFIIIFLCFVVFVLGFFAIKIATDALIYPFYHQEEQEGREMNIIVDKSDVFSDIFSENDLLDIQAIKQSFFINGEKVSELHDDDFDIHILWDSFVKVIPKKMILGDILRFSASEYNLYKKTAYNLPRDIELRIADKWNSIFVEEKWLPKDKLFSIWSEDFVKEDLEKIKFYQYTPNKGEECFPNESFWDREKIKKIPSKILKIHNNDSVVKWEYFIDYKNNLQQCVFGWVNGKMFEILNRTLESLVLKWNIETFIANDAHINHQVEFYSSHTLFDDISDPKKLVDYKKQLLKKVTFSPSVELSEKNIEIWENYFRITWDLNSDKKYVVHLTDIEDIYGRNFSSTEVLELSKKSVFSIIGDENFYDINEVKASVIVLNQPKNKFSMKLCKLDLSGYFQMQNLIKSKDREKYVDIYNILTSNNASKCEKTDIELQGDAPQTNLILKDVFPHISSGLYVFTLRNIEDAQVFDNFVNPMLFSVSPHKVLWNTNDENFSEFLVVDRKNGVAQARQDIELSFYSWENFNKNENKYYNFSTGVLLGKTDENGFLRVDTDDIFHSIPKSSVHSVIVARGEKWISLWEKQISTKKKKENLWKILTNKNIFIPWEKIFTSLILDEKGYKNFKNKWIVHFVLLDSEGVSHYNNTFKLEQSRVFTNEFILPKKEWNYVLRVYSSDDVNVFIEKNISIKNSENARINISLQGIDWQNNVPGDFRKIKNSNPEKNYYDFIFMSPLRFDAVVSVIDSQNQVIKNSNFSYKFYEKIGKSNEVLLEEWEWDIDNEGFGYLRLKRDFYTFHEDALYRLEVVFFDILSQQEVKQQSEVIVHLPDEYKTFSDEREVEIHLKKYIYSPGESISWNFSVSGVQNWEVQIKNKYNYKIIRKDTNEIIKQGLLVWDFFSFEDLWLHAGEYELQIFPNIEHQELLPKNLVAHQDFLVQWEEILDVKNNYIFYNNDFIEFISSYKNAKVLISFYVHWEIFSEYIPLIHGRWKKNISDFLRGWKKFYVRVLFLNEDWEVFFSSEKNFSKIKNTKKNEIKTNLERKIYASWELKNIEISTTEKVLALWWYVVEKNKTWKSEKLIFSIPTLTSNNNIFSVDFPKIIGNKNLKLYVFAYLWDDNVSEFSQEFSIRDDYSLVVDFPKNAYAWDKMLWELRVQNFSNKITQAEFGVEFRYGNEVYTQTGNLILNIWLSEKQKIDLKIPSHWIGEVPYSIFLKKDKILLFQYHGKIWVEPVPYIGINNEYIGFFRGNKKISLVANSAIDVQNSQLEVVIWKDFAVILPNLLKNIKNSQKSSIKENLQYFFLLSDIQRFLWEYNLFNKNEFVNNFHNWLSSENLDTWKKDRDYFELFILLKKIQKNGVEIPTDWLINSNMYIAEILHSSSINIDNSKKIQFLTLQYLSTGVFNREIFNTLKTDDFSLQNWTDYVEFLSITGQEVQKELYEIMRGKLWLSQIDRIKNIEILLWEWNFTGAERAFQEFFQENNISLTTFQEKILLAKIAMLHARIKSRIVDEIKFSTDTLRANFILSPKNSIHTLLLPYQKVKGLIELQSNSENNIFYAISEENTLQTPALFTEKVSNNLNLELTLYEIYEEKWRKNNWEFRLVMPVSNNFLEKWKLYKAVAKIEILDDKHLTKDLDFYQFLPNTDQIFVGPNRYWQKIFTKNNLNIFRIKTEKEKKQYEIVYYFRLKNSGSYLLPANFVYFIDDKGNVAHNSHQYLHIK